MNHVFSPAARELWLVHRDTEDAVCKLFVAGPHHPHGRPGPGRLGRGGAQQQPAGSPGRGAGGGAGGSPPGDAAGWGTRGLPALQTPFLLRG